MKIASMTSVVYVRDLGSSIKWYERLLGERSSIEPHPGIKEYELMPGCWLQIMQTAEPTTFRTLLRLGTDRLDLEHVRLRNLGFDVGPTEQIAGVMTRCQLRDPDGNVLTLYEML